ncbi:MAG: VWA domain-containing protein, partial [Planctomycetes bacterium]|nr:VWA domain-containing protein [Planctomycetota bacterium]
MNSFARFLADAAEPTKVTIDWMHPIDLWFLALVAAPIVLGGVWWLYRGERGELHIAARLALAALRAALIFAMIAFLCEPIETREQEQVRSGHLLVLIDDSFSMGIADRYADAGELARIEDATGTDVGAETRRIDLVQAFLRNPQHRFLSSLQAKGTIRVLAGSDGTETLHELGKVDSAGAAAEPALPEIALRGKVSRLGDFMYDAVNDLRSETVSSMVVFTDGRDNGGVLRPEEAARRLRRRDVPIHVVGVGNADEPKDVRV